MINLGSWIARLGIPVGSLYSSTQGAVETLTRGWAAEFGPAGAETARRAGVLMRGAPANATGSPDAIAHAAVYLASDEARFVPGTVIDVDGGRVGVAVMPVSEPVHEAAGSLRWRRGS
ncbi:MAG: SDR family oxidoreductase [Solirubrobacteraceae bacterium]